MYNCNVLLQTPKQFSLRLSKRMYIKPLPLFPWLYIYTNQWQIFHCSLIYSCIEMEEGKKKDTIKTTSLSLGIQCCTVSSRTHGQSAPRVPGSRAGFWWGGTHGRQVVEQGCTAREHWLTSQWTLHMACGLPVKLEQQAGNVLLICSITSVRSVLVSWGGTNKSSVWWNCELVSCSSGKPRAECWGEAQGEVPLSRESDSGCSSSCRSRWSWDSNCLLWSSNICILASRRPLCCLRSLASAMSSASSEACWGDTTESGGDARGFIPLRRCCSFSCSYSICRLL